MCQINSDCYWLSICQNSVWVIICNAKVNQKCQQIRRTSQSKLQNCFCKLTDELKRTQYCWWPTYYHVKKPGLSHDHKVDECRYYWWLTYYHVKSQACHMTIRSMNVVIYWWLTYYHVIKPGLSHDHTGRWMSLLLMTYLLSCDKARPVTWPYRTMNVVITDDLPIIMW